MRSLLLALIFASAMAAQVTDGSHLGEPVELTNNWRFHTGDDLHWSDAGFDDSAWPMMNATQSWEEQHLPQIRGPFWYRTRVHLTDDPPPLAIFVSPVGPYEIFVNGSRIGGFGAFPPHWKGYRGMPKAYSLPAVHKGDLVIAMHFWLWPQVIEVRGFPGAVYLGTRTDIDRLRELAVRETVDSLIPTNIVILLWLLLCGGLIVLFTLQPDRTEYIWLAVAGLSASVNGIRSEYQSLAGLDIVTAGYMASTLSAIGGICLLEFVFRFLREPMPKWVRAYQLLFPLTIIWLAVYLQNWVSASTFDTAAFVFHIPYWFVPPAIVLWRYWKGNKEAGLLAIPLYLIFLNEMLDTFRWLLWLFKLRRSSDALIGDIQFGFVSVGMEEIAHFLFLISVAALILYRFQKTRTEQARASAELEAARHMQEAMVPAPVPASGFQIEAAYIPAQEVGGDFYQLFPAEDGSLLVVIGDVSGKGLRAAMLVSLILGLLRSTVGETRSPSQILRRLNRFLVGHTDGKFATCCCVLLSSNGEVVAANAGHLSPYCDGTEIELPGGLPLGISPDADYEALHFKTLPGQRWVFLSDGVIEARSQSGELYGFDRARTISTRTATDIAAAAQRFGQEDDITVLGIQRETLAFA